MGLVVPLELQEVLVAADADPAPVDEMKLAGSLVAALGKDRSLTLEERRGAFAEIEALRFQRPLGSDRPSTWGIYWSELASGTTKDGGVFYSPDIAQVDEEIVAHWISRSAAAKNPVCRARFADLAWEIGRYLRKQTPSDGAQAKAPFVLEIPVSLAHRAIDAYLDAVGLGVAEDEFHAWQFLDRAIGLAAAINDAARIARSKTALFAHYHKVEGVGGKFMWWRFDDLAWEHRQVLAMTPEDKTFVIGVLERALARHADLSDTESFDPHWATGAADRLARRLAEAGDQEAARHALKTAGAAFEEAAKKASGLLALAWLEDLIPRYRNAGMTEDAARVERTIRERAKEAEKEIKRVEVPVEIPKEELDQWADRVASDSLESALTHLAAACLIHEDSARDRLKDMAEKAPLMAHMPIAILGADGFTRAKVGSIEGDLDGRAIMHAADLFNWHAPFLHVALERIKAKHGMALDALVASFSDAPLFPVTREPLLKEGLAAWLAEDYVKAIHVLVPQLEAALRDLLAGLGAPVQRPNAKTGGFEVIGMGAVLNHGAFQTGVPKDLRFHLRALYCDPRGINLRNHLAHGLAHPQLFGRGVCNWVVHSLLLVKTLRFRQSSAGEDGQKS